MRRLPNAITIALTVMLAAVIGIMYAELQTGGAAPGPTPTAGPPATIPAPTATPTITPPPPLSGDLPGIRTAWLPIDQAGACDVSPNAAGVVYLTDGGCEVTDAMIDAGEGTRLGLGTVHLPACPGIGGYPRGRYVLLSPDDESARYEYPAPLSITLDGIDQRPAFIPQARIVNYHQIPYRAYVTAWEMDCRSLTGAVLYINPHPQPTPTPTPDPNATATPEP